jgi:hypothetical protein
MVEFERRLLGRLLHVVTLSAFAIAQPIFDVLSRHSEFFVAQRSEGVDIALLIVFLSLFVPFLLFLPELALGLLSFRLGLWSHRILVALLASLIVSPAFSKVLVSPAEVVIGVSVLVGAILVGFYCVFSLVRRFVTVLSLAIVLFPGLFLLNLPLLERLLSESPRPPSATVGPASAAPIVFVIFDELPVTSIMDLDFEVDEVRFPGFARLARDSYWFRHARAFGGTAVSVPSILSGQDAPRGGKKKLATRHYYPNNLFTLLGDGYEITSFEAVSHLCPKSRCTDLRGVTRVPSVQQRLAPLLLDVSVVFLHLITPEDLVKHLPPISDTWGDFVPHTSSPKRGASGNYSGPNKPRLLEAFVDSIVPSSRPTLHFLHVTLPHIPWVFYPSGKLYTRYSLKMDSLVGGGGGTLWADDEFLVSQGFRRHLLQVKLVDNFIDRLIERMSEVGVYDRSLLVITADHGVSFTPGRNRRTRNANPNDITLVPLFIKVPNQTASRVIDTEVRSVDILPTIADVIGQSIPFHVDGRSLLDVVDRDAHLEEPTGTLKERYRTIEQIAKYFGTNSNSKLYSHGKFAELVGVSPSGQNLANAKNSVSFDLFNRGDVVVDPQSISVPGLIVGAVAPEEGSEEVIHFAIAVNGVIRVVTRTYKLKDTVRFSGLVPEESFRAGENRVEVYRIVEDHSEEAN